MTVKTKAKRSRVERARQTRRRMIDSALDLFVTRGYATTTLEQVASAAGVAVQTIYYTFKTKGQLLAEVVEVTAAGADDPGPRTDRPWVREMLACSSPARVLALGVENGTGIYDRVAFLWPAVAAAAEADPHVAAYWQAVVATRRNHQRALVLKIAELGGLRRGIEIEQATDQVVVLAGPDVYRGLVVESRWDVATYRRWLFELLVTQLLDPRKVDPQAAKGLSFARSRPRSS